MSIADNKKAFFDYYIEERYEAGIVLEGWEVKAIRAGQANIKEAYVIVRDGAIFVIGAHISALKTASTHVHPEATRTRKLLLHKKEIERLIGKVAERGLTLVPLNLHYKASKIKLEIGLAKGKKEHDKRAVIKEREGKREVSRAMKTARGT